MAGAVKHMERSRRSHTRSRDFGIYTQFHRNAYSVKTFKKNRLSLGQRIAKMLHKEAPTSK